MRLEDIATFVEAVEAGTLVGAADVLGVPKSTVSRRVARLEADLGEELIRRHSRLFELTDVGRGLYERSASAVRDLQRAAREVHDAHDDVAGELRMTLPQDIGLSDELLDLLAGFRQAHPGVELFVDLSDRKVDLVAERFDFAFRGHMNPLEDTASLKARSLGRLAVGLYASARYLAQRGAPACPADLGDHAILAPFSGAYAFELTHRDSGTVERLQLHACLRASSITFLPYMAARDTGIAPVPRYIASRHVARGDLVPVLEEWELPAATLSLLWPVSSLPHPRRRAFLDYVAAHWR
ncbi:MAG: LysR family transcriptional regulator [Deltaproteobacteria bacterium]|nr:MAG: LysR family transcriptional regulator [Deltaproteobacteria bacterium]